MLSIAYLKGGNNLGFIICLTFDYLSNLTFSRFPEIGKYYYQFF